MCLIWINTADCKFVNYHIDIILYNTHKPTYFIIYLFIIIIFSCEGLTCHCVNSNCNNSTCTRNNFYSYCDITINTEEVVVQGCGESIFSYQACKGELDYNPSAHIPYQMCCRTHNCNSVAAIQQLINALFTSSQVSPSSTLPTSSLTSSQVSPSSTLSISSLTSSQVSPSPSLPVTTITPTSSIQVTTAHLASVQLTTGMFSFLPPFSLSTITYKLFILVLSN